MNLARRDVWHNRGHFALTALGIGTLLMIVMGMAMLGLWPRRVRDSAEGRMFLQVPPRFPVSDLDCCLSVDRFDFAMVVERRDSLLVMRAVR